MNEQEAIEQLREALKAVNAALSAVHEAGLDASVDVIPVQKMGERYPRQILSVRVTKVEYEIDETVG